MKSPVILENLSFQQKFNSFWVGFVQWQTSMHLQKKKETPFLTKYSLTLSSLPSDAEFA